MYWLDLIKQAKECGTQWVMGYHRRGVKLGTTISHGGGSEGGRVGSEGSGCRRDVNRYWSLTRFGIFPSTEHRIWHGMPSVHSVKEDHQGELQAENWD